MPDILYKQVVEKQLYACKRKYEMLCERDRRIPGRPGLWLFPPCHEAELMQKIVSGF